MTFGLSFTIGYAASKGLGKHDNNIPESWRAPLTRLEYTFTVLYNPALMATKTSILIFYLRLAKNTQVFLRSASYVTIAIVNIAGFVFMFLNVFQCSPIYVGFTPHTTGKCIPIVTLYLCSAPINIATDLAILVLPIPVLTGMRLPRKQKAILIFTFALGIFTTIIGVVRIYYLQQAFNTQVNVAPGGQIGNSVDFSWTGSLPLMWSAVEVNTGIICGCTPTLKPLFQRILPAIIIDLFESKSIRSRNLDSQGRSDPSDMHHGSSVATDYVMEIQSPPSGEIGRRQEGEIEMMGFPTTPYRGEERADTRMTPSNTADSQGGANRGYFGFFRMRRPRSMLIATGKESFKYCSIVTTLFFLWGFSYGLLINLVNETTQLTRLTFKQDIALTSAYFVGYFLGPVSVGQWVLRHKGFKASFICGLCIYCIGTLMFWPSAALSSFPGLLVCQVVVSFGLSILETAAKPFLVLCGPQQYAEVRLLLAEGVESTANVLSEVLAQRVLFSRIDTKLAAVQWTYLAIALFSVILALFFYYIPLPEATDVDLQSLSERGPISQTFFSTKVPLQYITLVLAVFAYFCFVSALESTYVWQGLLLSDSRPPANPTLRISSYGLLSQTTFVLGRFLFAALCLVILPRLLLLFASILGTIFATLVTSLHLNTNGIAAVFFVFLFFVGPISSLIFAIGLRGMGKRTKSVAASLVASSCGSAIFPYVMWVIVYVNHKSVQYSFCVIVALFAFGTIFPAYLTLVSNAGRQIDPVRTEERNRSLTDLGRA
jgi:fucose permease